MLSDAEIRSHNDEVADLWAAFGRGENRRVPVWFACDEALWLRLAGRGYRELYEDPRVQLEVQLGGLAWWGRNVVHDQRMGPPEEAWTVGVRWWMEEAEFLGCQVRTQEDSYAWSIPLALGKAELLEHLRGIDAKERIQSGTTWRLWQGLGECAEGRQSEGLPVRVAAPGGSTHGVFTVACAVRGSEQMCLDVAEDPGFVGELLAAITDKTLERIGAWRELTGDEGELPNAGGWGMCDDAIQLLSEGQFREHVLPHHRRLYDAMTTGHRQLHLCGYAQQHYRTLYGELGIRTLDGPGPFADVGGLLAECPGLAVNAQTDHSLLLTGSEDVVAEGLRRQMSPGFRQAGRVHVMGYVGPGTPMGNVRAMYEAGKRYGAIDG